MNKFKVALLQTDVCDDKEKNIENAVRLIERVSKEGADIAVLPEMFCCPYNSSLFRAYGENEGGAAYTAMSKAAKDCGIYVVAGTIPELKDNKVYNTSYVFNRNGIQIAKHRKMHLFDIDIEGGQYFKESDTLTSGGDVTLFDTEFCRIGLAICYDIRFPELSRLMAAEGAEVIIYPGAFNMTTGPAHWELSFRARALDNQVYTIGVAPARDLEAMYHSYGNSIVASPWGNVLSRMDEKEGYIIQEIDLDYVKKIRNELPLLKHIRKDIYKLLKSK
ncbi:carbon-nitrogen hydrolase family protein [Sedimentibacter hydroxybenzoicus DSM 7310]|uniref:Carbon-nitrogen hydrolase family protein n=1 Tax=Sedimentibacter hydroxybenzoicus DSM 7310 TaxID=1123245 RepID=A0A974GX23_SEDHY|nr:carbon-nitrogen hydrolase family protein [Sedimentibacter hydroxybenzoicus]NYB75068.1 carbon-nitrogen hydrolase family protein [Sedimentibacter hydroxybenzoicus DSM 7310]